MRLEFDTSTHKNLQQQEGKQTQTDYEAIILGTTCERDCATKAPRNSSLLKVVLQLQLKTWREDKCRNTTRTEGWKRDNETLRDGISRLAYQTLSTIFHCGCCSRRETLSVTHSAMVSVPNMYICSTNTVHRRSKGGRLTFQLQMTHGIFPTLGLSGHSANRRVRLRFV